MGNQKLPIETAGGNCPIVVVRKVAAVYVACWEY